MKINRLKRNLRVYRFFFKRFMRSRLYYVKVFFLQRKKFAPVCLAVLCIAFAAWMLTPRGRGDLPETARDYAEAAQKGAALYADERYEKAYEYLSAAAPHDAHAAFLLGMMHYNGAGVERDVRQAYEYFKIAAEQESEAKFMLAQMGFRGEAKGLRKGLPTKLLVEAAYAGVRGAQSALGTLYMLSNEREQAYFWLSLAQKQGDFKAEKQLQTLKKHLPESEKSLLDLEVDGFTVIK